MGQAFAFTRLGHRTPLRAAVTSFFDLRSGAPSLPPVGETVRLDGQTALVTGANSGLGKAVSIDLARRGARVILACRSGIPGAGLDIARKSGSEKVEMSYVDLSDLDSVVALSDELARRNETIDVLVCNAGLMPSKATVSKQGYDVMFAVHYLANHLLVRRLLTSGVIPNDVYAANGRRSARIPRIVFVASEAHRSSDHLDFRAFGAFTPYPESEVLLHYAASKLALLTFAAELSRRLSTVSGPSVAVHGLCPGPIASGITRDAPKILQPIIGPVMRALFQIPEQAARPVVYLAIAPELAVETGWYMYLMRRSMASPAAASDENGRLLWERGEALLAPWLAAV